MFDRFFHLWDDPAIPQSWKIGTLKVLLAADDKTAMDALGEVYGLVSEAPLGRASDQFFPKFALALTHPDDHDKGRAMYRLLSKKQKSYKKLPNLARNLWDAFKPNKAFYQVNLTAASITLILGALAGGRYDWPLLSIGAVMAMMFSTPTYTLRSDKIVRQFAEAQVRFLRNQLAAGTAAVMQSEECMITFRRLQLRRPEH